MSHIQIQETREEGVVGLPNNLYTPEEVAVKLKMSRRAIYQWLTSGKLPGLKVGQGWRITEDALIAFMNSGDPTLKEHEVDPE